MVYFYKTKKCSACKRWKSSLDFYKRGDKKGCELQSHCKNCVIKKWKGSYSPEEQHKRNRSYTIKYPDKKRDVQYKYHYGITVSDYNNLLTQQNHRCKICSVPQSECIRRFAVDHIRGTKIVRGLLCHKCNLAIGLLNDNPRLFGVTKNYLEEYVSSRNCQ